MQINYSELIDQAEKSNQDLSLYWTDPMIKLARLYNIVQKELDNIIYNICRDENRSEFMLNDQYIVELHFNQFDHENYTTEDIRLVFNQFGIKPDSVVGTINEELYNYNILFRINI